MKLKKKTKIQDPVFDLKNKLVRTAWYFVYHSLFRLTPTPLFGFRRLLLRSFGAKVGKNCNIYPSVKIWLPSNLELANASTLGPDSKIYNQGRIKIGENATISQGAYLCASTHDYNDPIHPLILAPITIEKKSWICAEAFIGPGVIVGEGAVIGARAVLTRSAERWCVYAGNPAKKIKERTPF